MSFCTKCGRQLADNAQFCSGCGTPVSGAPAPAKKKPASRMLPLILIGILLVVVIALSVIIVTSGLIEIPFFAEPTSAVEEDPHIDQEPEEPHLETEPTEPPTEEVIAEKVTVSAIVPQYGSKSADWWSQFEYDFEKTYKNVDLIVDVLSWNDIYTVVNLRISNDEIPDIVNIDVFADYQADGLLLPVADYMSDETYAKFYPAFLEQSVVDDTVWAVPDLASVRGLYYNADILEAAGVKVPASWAALEAACAAIRVSDFSVSPFGMDLTTNEGHVTFAHLIWSNGGGFADTNGNWTLNSPRNAEAIRSAVRLVNTGNCGDAVWYTRYDQESLFSVGKLAMFVAPCTTAVLQADEWDFDWGVAPIPATGSTPATVGVMDRMMCFDNDYSDAELAAITAFFDFFYDDDRYADWVMMEGFLPATSTGMKAMAAKDPSAAVWREILLSAQFFPAAESAWSDVRSGVVNVMSQAMAGGDVQSLLDDLQRQIAG